jgi:hypothetical protein
MPRRVARRAKQIAGLVSAVAFTAYVPAGLAAGSTIRTWVSPDRKVTISSVKVGSENDLGYQLNLTQAGHAPVIIDRYDRDVDVLWSPDSKHVAVTDWIGSNIADCYIITVDKPATSQSVTDTLPEIREDVTNSHFYVSCNHWENSRTIAVKADGHTDYPPYHDFRYRFVLDVVTGRITRP